MNLLKKGDIVSRKSHNNDILFYIEEIDEQHNYARLKGVIVRIEADSTMDDLELADNTRINSLTSQVDKIINSSINCFSIFLYIYARRRNNICYDYLSWNKC